MLCRHKTAGRVAATCCQATQYTGPSAAYFGLTFRASVRLCSAWPSAGLRPDAATLASEPQDSSRWDDGEVSDKQLLSSFSGPGFEFLSDPEAWYGYHETLGMSTLLSNMLSPTWTSAHVGPVSQHSPVSCVTRSALRQHHRLPAPCPAPPPATLRWDRPDVRPAAATTVYDTDFVAAVNEVSPSLPLPTLIDSPLLPRLSVLRPLQACISYVPDDNDRRQRCADPFDGASLQQHGSHHNPTDHQP